VTRAAALLLAVAACGGSSQHATPPPPPPPPYDPGPLAAELHGEIVKMAMVVASNQSDCPRMAHELGALFETMRASVTEAKRVKQDPEAAKALTTELHRYDAEMTGLSDRIAAGLVTCHDNLDLRDVMVTMPTL
jgi:pullulanase/glycogen debranching enzyme